MMRVLISLVGSVIVEVVMMTNEFEEYVENLVEEIFGGSPDE